MTKIQHSLWITISNLSLFYITYWWLCFWILKTLNHPQSEWCWNLVCPQKKKHIIIINKIPKEAEDINGMHDLLKFSSVYLRYMQMIFIIGNGNLYEQGILLREQQMITSQVLLTYFLWYVHNPCLFYRLFCESTFSS